MRYKSVPRRSVLIAYLPHNSRWLEKQAILVWVGRLHKGHIQTSDCKRSKLIHFTCIFRIMKVTPLI